MCVSFFFLAALEYYLLGCFHIACHLAAESGTRVSLPVYMSPLLGVYNSYFFLFLGVFSWEFLIVLFSSYVDDIAFIKI